MKYYIGNIPFDPNYLEHYGVKGMKWGKHRTRAKDPVKEERNRISDWWTGRSKLTEVREHDKVAKQEFANKIEAKNNGNIASLDRANKAYYEERAMATKSREAYSRAPRQVVERLSSKGKAFIYRLLGKSPAPVVNKPRGGKAER